MIDRLISLVEPFAFALSVVLTALGCYFRGIAIGEAAILMLLWGISFQIDRANKKDAKK